MTEPEKKTAAAEIVEATKDLQESAATPDETIFRGIATTNQGIQKRLDRADIYSDKIDELTTALVEMCGGTEEALRAQRIEREQLNEKHSGENYAHLRGYNRTVHGILDALRLIDVQRLSQQGTQYINQWVQTVKTKLKLKDDTIDTLKAIIQSDTPDYSQLFTLIGGELAAQLAKSQVLENTHGLMRRKITDATSHAQAEEAKKQLLKRFESVTRGSIGIVPTEEVITSLAKYSKPDDTDALYAELESSGVLKENALVLLRFGRTPLYITWETNANTAKKQIREALQRVDTKEDGMGKITHAQTWLRDDQKAVFDSLPDGAEFRAIWVRDGLEVSLKKTGKGTLDKNTLKTILAKKGEEITAEAIEEKIEHYLAQIVEK